jgi:tetratricopeptide (TPR) repeat protein
MAIKGSLAEAALPNVIQLLTISLKSGCLSVTDGKNFGNIFIKDGKIIYATILNREKRLGDILILKGEIDKDTLSRALGLQKSQRNKRIGEILIEIGAITRDTLEKELKEQIEQTIFTMLTWDSGFFNFEAGLLPAKEEYTVKLFPQEVLLEAARRIDEWRKIENKMPSFETKLVPKGNPDKVPLTEQERKLLNIIDGTHNIDEVLRLSEFEFFETCRAVYGLMSAGLLEKPEGPVKKKPADISEGRSLGLGFYRTEMLSDAEREYRKILEVDKDDPEALLYLGLIELRRDNYQAAKNYFLKSLKKERKLSLLINLGYVCNKLNQHDEAIKYLNEAKESAPKDQKVKCNLGITFYKQGKLDESYGIFQQIYEESRDCITSYIYLSIIKLKRGKTEEALNLLRESIDRFPDLIAFRNNLAIIYKSIDKPDEAEKLYRQALELDPQNAIICKNLADFYYGVQILGAARELFERIPEEKRDWQINFKLGNIYLRQGDSKKALNFWNRARELNPSEKLIMQNIEVLKRASSK